MDFVKILLFPYSMFHRNKTHTYTQHNRFTARLEFVQDHPGEQVPER